METEDELGELAPFKQYLQDFADQNGYLYTADSYENHTKHPALDLRVRVFSEKISEVNYTVRLVVSITSSCSTSTVSSATVNPQTGNVSYQIVKLSMS